MSLLKRILLIIGLSVTFTTCLMVIFWEPERAVERLPVQEMTAPRAPTVAPVIYRSAEVRTGTTPLRASPPHLRGFVKPVNPSTPRAVTGLRVRRCRGHANAVIRM